MPRAEPALLLTFHFPVSSIRTIISFKRWLINAVLISCNHVPSYKSEVLLAPTRGQQTTAHFLIQTSLFSNFQIKFYWNTVKPILLCIVCGCFVLSDLTGNIDIFGLMLQNAWLSAKCRHLIKQCWMINRE